MRHKDINNLTYLGLRSPPACGQRVNGKERKTLANRRTLEVRLLIPPFTTQFPPTDHFRWLQTDQCSTCIGGEHARHIRYCYDSYRQVCLLCLLQWFHPVMSFHASKGKIVNPYLYCNERH